MNNSQIMMFRDFAQGKCSKRKWKRIIASVLVIVDLDYNHVHVDPPVLEEKKTCSIEYNRK